MAATVLEGLDDIGAILVLSDRSRTEDADIVFIPRACAAAIQDGLANELVGHGHFPLQFEASHGLSRAQCRRLPPFSGRESLTWPSWRRQPLQVVEEHRKVVQRRSHLDSVARGAESPRRWSRSISLSVTMCRLSRRVWKARSLRRGSQQRVGDDHRRQEKREQDGRDEPILPDESALLHLVLTFQPVGSQRRAELVGIEEDHLARHTGRRIGGKEEQRTNALPGGERQAFERLLFGITRCWPEGSGPSTTDSLKRSSVHRRWLEGGPEQDWLSGGTSGIYIRTRALFGLDIAANDARKSCLTIRRSSPVHRRCFRQSHARPCHRSPSLGPDLARHKPIERM